MKSYFLTSLTQYFLPWEKNLLLNGLNIKIEREVIETHNLYSPKQKSNMQIWKWEDSASSPYTTD